MTERHLIAYAILLLLLMTGALLLSRRRRRGRRRAPEPHMRIDLIGDGEDAGGPKA